MNAQIRRKPPRFQNPAVPLFLFWHQPSKAASFTLIFYPTSLLDQTELTFNTSYPDSALAETEDDEDWEKCSSAKTNSILSQCKSIKMDNDVDSGIAESIHENFCTSGTPSFIWTKWGQNIFQPNLNYQVAVKTGFTVAGQLMHNHMSALKLSGNRSPDNKSDFAGSQAQGTRSRPPAPSIPSLQQAITDPCPPARQLRAQPRAWPPPSPLSEWRQPNFRRHSASLERWKAKENAADTTKSLLYTS